MIFSPIFDNPLHTFSNSGLYSSQVCRTQPQSPIGQANPPRLRKSCMKNSVLEKSELTPPKPNVKWASPISQARIISAQHCPWDYTEPYNTTSQELQPVYSWQTNQPGGSGDPHYLAFTNNPTSQCQSSDTHLINDERRSQEYQRPGGCFASNIPPDLLTFHDPIRRLPSDSAILRNNLRHLNFTPPRSELPCPRSQNSGIEVTSLQVRPAGEDDTEARERRSSGQESGFQMARLQEQVNTGQSLRRNRVVSQLTSDPDNHDGPERSPSGRVPSAARPRSKDLMAVKKDSLHGRQPYPPKGKAVSRVAATYWASELDTFQYLQETRRVDKRNTQRLLNLLDRMDKSKGVISAKLLEETRLAKRVRTFAHRNSFGVDCRKKAKSILDHWSHRFYGKSLAGRDGVGRCGDSGDSRI